MYWKIEIWWLKYIWYFQDFILPELNLTSMTTNLYNIWEYAFVAQTSYSNYSPETIFSSISIIDRYEIEEAKIARIILNAWKANKQINKRYFRRFKLVKISKTCSRTKNPLGLVNGWNFTGGLHSLKYSYRIPHC